ncbi:MAG: hypothetical protein QOF39_2687 [Frankiales bacterium]|nr:hypothetical protein [Frankiales bacterium]
MADHTRTVTLETDADTAYKWLSDMDNLPKYLDLVTPAQPGRDGGEAWLRTDDPARRLEWGSADDATDPLGWLKVSAIEGGSAVTLGVHLPHSAADEAGERIDAALENVRRELDRT